MGDEEIAVLSLPVERHHSMTDTGDSCAKELNEKRDAEQHRHLKTNAAADHRCGPVKYFYAGRNGDQHRRNCEEDIKWTAHPHGEHVTAPDAKTQDSDGYTRSRDKFVTEDWFARKDR